MDDIENLLARRVGAPQRPVDVNEVERLILESVQDAGSNPLAFSTLEGGIAELSQRFKQFRDLPPDEQRNLYIDALDDLSRRDTTFKGGQPVSLFGKMMLGALGIIGKVGDVATNPTKIVGVSQEFLAPAMRGFTGKNHPNNPRASQSSGSALVGGGMEEFIPKIVEKVEQLQGRIAKLEGPPAPEGVPLPN